MCVQPYRPRLSWPFNIYTIHLDIASWTISILWESEFSVFKIHLPLARVKNGGRPISFKSLQLLYLLCSLYLSPPLNHLHTPAPFPIAPL